MYKGGDGKNRETFPHIPDEPSKLRNFSPSKLLSFTVLPDYITVYAFYKIFKVSCMGDIEQNILLLFLHLKITTSK